MNKTPSMSRNWLAVLPGSGTPDSWAKSPKEQRDAREKRTASRREPASASRRHNRPAFLKQLHAPGTSLGPVSSASAISRDGISEYTSRLRKLLVPSTDRAGQRSRLENRVRYLRLTRA